MPSESWENDRANAKLVQAPLETSFTPSNFPRAITEDGWITLLSNTGDADAEPVGATTSELKINFKYRLNQDVYVGQELSTKSEIVGSGTSATTTLKTVDAPDGIRRAKVTSTSDPQGELSLIHI